MNKLFIYIPTYNRLNSIVAQLNSLIPQLKNNKNVRLHINDNASTQYDLQSLASVIPINNISIRKNECNIDGGANQILGFTYCRPDEALWILSDNDIVNENAVNRILSEVNNEFDLICMRTSTKINYSDTYMWESGWSPEISNDTGLISSIVYNTPKFHPHVLAGFFYHNSCFPPLAIMLTYAKYNKIIKFRNIERLFSPSHYGGDEISDYSLSQLGMPLLSELMPKDKAIEFCRMWLSLWADVFFQKKEKFPSVFEHSLNYMKGLSPDIKALLEQHIDAVVDKKS